MILAKMLGLLPMFIILLSKPTVSSPTTLPIAKPGCNDQCGEVKIPYPFGMTEGCFLDKRFLITCNNSYNPPEPFLGDSMINVTELSLQGQLRILKSISRECYDQLGQFTEGVISIFRIPKFTINSTINKLVAVGCDTAGFARGFRNSGDNNQLQIVGPVGCISLCENKESVINGSCSGGGCCQTSIPSRISELNLTAGSFHSHIYVYDFNPCSYAFIVEEGKFNFSFESLIDLRSIKKLPLVLDWAIGDEMDTCETAKLNSSSFACQNNTNCLNNQDDYFGYRCSCKEGYQGNPYLPNIGCQDIDECQNEETNNCTFKELCKNVEGDYKCSCRKGYRINGDGKGSEGCMLKSTRSHQLLVARILAGIAVGTAVALVGCSWYYFRYRRKRLISMMGEGLYHGNEGTGTNGEQHLSELNGSSNNTNFSGTQSDEKPTNRLMRNA